MFRVTQELKVCPDQKVTKVQQDPKELEDRKEIEGKMENLVMLGIMDTQGSQVRLVHKVFQDLTVATGLM